MLLDGARHPDIAPLVRFGRLEFACLYSGSLSPTLQAAAPYIVHLAAASAQTRELLSRAWGNSWGMLTIGPSHLMLDQQRMHFKKMLRVCDESGQRLNFRFYDPRVLRIYLPTCTRDELTTFFGPVPQFVLEGATSSELVDYVLDRNGLRVASHCLSDGNTANNP